MPIVEAVLTPAGPYSGTVPTLTAYVDDGSGNPDPSYAGQTVVLCLDQRSNANPESGGLLGDISAVLDGSGQATFTGLTTEASYWYGNTAAYLVAVVVPTYTWTAHYSDSFTLDGNTPGPCDITGPGTFCGNIVTISPYHEGSAWASTDFSSASGTGASSTITMTFSSALSSFGITVLDANFAGNQVKSYDASNVLLETVNVVEDGSPGTFPPSSFAVNLTVPGIRKIELIPAASDYVAYRFAWAAAGGDHPILARYQNGALSGTVVGHLPDSPNPFIWTDAAWDARLYGGAVDLWDNSDHPHGVNGDSWGGSYAWDIASGDNVKRDCRLRMEVTATVGLNGSSDNLGVIGMMPNFLSYNDYEGYWWCSDPATTTELDSYEFWDLWEDHLFFWQYGAGKGATRYLPKPTAGVTTAVEVWSVGDYMFVRRDGVFELGMAIDSLTVTTAAPYIDCFSDWDVRLRFDNFTMDLPTEGGPMTVTKSVASTALLQGAGAGRVWTID